MRCDLRAHFARGRQHRHAKADLWPPFGQIEKLHEGHVLRPDVCRAFEINVFSLVLPGTDGREARRRIMRFGPMAEVYRRSGRTPWNAAERHRAIGGAEVL